MLVNRAFERKSKTNKGRVEEASGRRVTRSGIETCYNGAQRRGNESITSRKQLGEGSRCLGINSEKAPGTSQQNEDRKKMVNGSLDGKMAKIVARSAKVVVQIVEKLFF